MKQLQNDYTTVEQSKRLKELGLPTWTANYVYTKIAYRADNDEPIYSDSPVAIDGLTIIGVSLENSLNDDRYIYAWSVGRLIEIFELCTPYTINQFDFTGTYVERMCKSFLFAKEMNTLDFSKLLDFS